MELEDSEDSEEPMEDMWDNMPGLMEVLTLMNLRTLSLPMLDYSTQPTMHGCGLGNSDHKQSGTCGWKFSLECGGNERTQQLK